MNVFRTIHRNYVAFSANHKYITSILTAGGVLTVSDCTAQYWSSKWINNYQFDYRRTLSMLCFGLFYYGILARTIYSVYDIMFGPKNALLKAFMDIGPHTWLLFVPAFYYSTGLIKGYDIDYITNQLKKEYVTAASGSAIYWAPVMFVSFRYCTIHTRILWITTFSFIHKTALSWYSNRTRVSERTAMLNNVNNGDTLSQIQMTQ